MCERYLQFWLINTVIEGSGCCPEGLWTSWDRPEGFLTPRRPSRRPLDSLPASRGALDGPRKQLSRKNGVWYVCFYIVDDVFWGVQRGGRSSSSGRNPGTGAWPRRSCTRASAACSRPGKHWRPRRAPTTPCRTLSSSTRRSRPSPPRPQRAGHLLSRQLLPTTRQSMRGQAPLSHLFRLRRPMSP